MGAKEQKPARRHHIVPEFYLKLFEDGDGRLLAFNTETGKVVPGNAKYFGWRRDMYTLPAVSPGIDALLVEHTLAKLESIWKPCIWKVLESVALIRREGYPSAAVIIDGQLRSIVATFMTMQFIRTPFFRQVYEETNPQPRTSHAAVLFHPAWNEIIKEEMEKQIWVVAISWRWKVSLFVSDDPVNIVDDRLDPHGKRDGSLFHSREFNIPLARHVLLRVLSRDTFADRVHPGTGHRYAELDGRLVGLPVKEIRDQRSRQMRGSSLWVYSDVDEFPSKPTKAIGASVT